MLFRKGNHTQNLHSVGMQLKEAFLRNVADASIINKNIAATMSYRKCKCSIFSSKKAHCLKIFWHIYANIK
jgi:hypothetical protein